MRHSKCYLWTGLRADVGATVSDCKLRDITVTLGHSLPIPAIILIALSMMLAAASCSDSSESDATESQSGLGDDYSSLAPETQQDQEESHKIGDVIDADSSPSYESAQHTTSGDYEQGPTSEVMTNRGRTPEHSQLGETGQHVPAIVIAEQKVDESVSIRSNDAGVAEAPESDMPDNVDLLATKETDELRMSSHAPDWPFRGALNLVRLPIGTLESDVVSGASFDGLALQYWDEDEDLLTELLLADNPRDHISLCPASIRFYVDDQGVEIANILVQESPVYWIPWGGVPERRSWRSPEIQATFVTASTPIRIGDRELTARRIADWVHISDGVLEDYYPVFYRTKWDPGKIDLDRDYGEGGFGHYPELGGTDGESYGILLDSVEPICGDDVAWLVSASSGRILACGWAIATPRLVLPPSRAHEFMELAIPEEAMGKNYAEVCPGALDLGELGSIRLTEQMQQGR